MACFTVEVDLMYLIRVCCMVCFTVEADLMYLIVTCCLADLIDLTVMCLISHLTLDVWQIVYILQ